jgi:class 3 adenylate cyclase
MIVFPRFRDFACLSDVVSFGEMERRLSAILAADVVGYSRMMGTNEAGTLAHLDAEFIAIFQRTLATAEEFFQFNRA